MAIAFKMTKDPTTGLWLEDIEGEENVIADSPNVGAVFKKALIYAKRTQTPTLVLHDGIWITFYVTARGKVKIQHRIHDSDAEGELYDILGGRFSSEATPEEKPLVKQAILNHGKRSRQVLEQAVRASKTIPSIQVEEIEDLDPIPEVIFRRLGL